MLYDTIFRYPYCSLFSMRFYFMLGFDCFRLSKKKNGSKPLTHKELSRAGHAFGQKVAVINYPKAGDVRCGNVR